MKALSTADLQSVGDAWLLRGSHRPLGPISIDSRTLQPGSTFVCIRGPRFDGHDFVQAAVRAGAKTVIVDRVGAEMAPRNVGATVIAVPDTVAVLGDLAREHRARYPGVVVGLTGSSGKTTTKDFIAAALAVAGPTHKTQGNLNNHLGVPLTVLGLRAEHRYAVIEMGMSAPGEISYLSHITKPHIGVFTTVGAAHLAGVGGLGEVAAAKGEMTESVDTDGAVIMPSHIDYPWVLTRSLHSELITVGYRRVDALRLTAMSEGARGAMGTVHVDGETHRLRLKIAGRYNLVNALLALAVARRVGIPMTEAVAAISAVPAPALRGEIRKLPGGRRVVMDCYNANPQSMRAAIKAFIKRAPQGILVLGDMLELGPAGPTAHGMLGVEIAAIPSQPTLIAVGPLAKDIAGAAHGAGMPASLIHHAADAVEASQIITGLSSDAPILLKGSRGMRLERVFTELSQGAS